jgi:hypothetical protein
MVTMMMMMEQASWSNKNHFPLRLCGNTALAASTLRRNKPLMIACLNG